MQQFSELFKEYDNKKYSDTDDESVKDISKRISKLKNDNKWKEYNNTDFIPYPQINEDHFHRGLNAKTEISRNKMSSIDKNPCNKSTFELTKNQKFLRSFMSNETPYNGILLYHGVGVGKCFAKDTQILMFNGKFCNVQDINVGDVIMGDDNTERNVLTTIKGYGKMYKIIPSLGMPFTVNKDHILCLVYNSGTKVDMSVKQYLSLDIEHRRKYKGYRASNIMHTIYDEEYKKSHLHAKPIYERCNEIISALKYHSKISYNDRYLYLPYNYELYNALLSIGISCHVKGDIMYLFGKSLIKFKSYIHDDVNPDIFKLDLTFDFDILECPQDSYFGFSVDGNHRFVIQDYIVTHNSCSAITIAENYDFNKRPVVLLPSSLMGNFRLQVYDKSKGYNQCTGNKYNSISDGEKVAASKYDLYGYLQFANKVDNLKKNTSTHYRYVQKIKNEFSNRVFIIDEAHNTRSDDKSNIEKNIPPVLRDVLKYSINVKLILLTATPMYNSVTEIIWLLNLLLLNDKRTPLSISDVFDKDGHITENGMEILREKSRGYISYLRTENPYAFPVRLPGVSRKHSISLLPPNIDKNGIEIEKDERLKYTDDLPIVYSKMHEKHASYMQQLTSSENRNNFSTAIIEEGNVFSKASKDAKLQDYAPKIATILEYVKNAEGIVFIYSLFIERGVKVIVKALEQAGYSKYVEGSKNKNSYIALTGEKELSGNNDKEIQIARSYENRNGDLIKVIVGSSVVAEGVDFKNIREIHILEPWYHLNKLDQIIGRGSRFCSHIDLPEEERNVSVYLHCLRYPNETKKYIQETIDEYVYRTAQYKMDEIKKVNTILQENAIDCNLNIDALNYIPSKERTLRTSQGKIIKYNYSQKSSKMKCLYKDDRSISDDSTLSKSFFVEDIAEVKNKIGLFYNDTNVSYTFKEITNKLKNVDEEIVIYALHDMLINRYPINDDKGYLIYRSNMYIYNPNHGKKVTYSDIKNKPYKKRLVFISEADEVDEPVINKKKTNLKLTDVNVDIEGEFDRIVSLLSINPKKFRKSILDYIFERITDFEQITTLCKSPQLEKDYKESMQRCHILLDSSMKYIRDIHNGNIYTFHNNDYVEANSYDLQSLKVDDKPVVNAKSKLIHNKKKGVIQYKLVEKSNPNGYECVGTTTLTKKLMLEKISELDLELNVSKLTKDKLCILHEILQRYYKKDEFAGIYKSSIKIS